MDLGAHRDHPFLRTLSDEWIERLRPYAREVQYRENAFVFREGAEADTLYLLRSGAVALEQHIPTQGVVMVESLRAGDILGLSWLFPAHHWTLDARCVEPVQAIAFGADCLRDRMMEDQVLGHELLTHVVEALYQRLMRVRLQRLDVYKARG